MQLERTQHFCAAFTLLEKAIREALIACRSDSKDSRCASRTRGAWNCRILATARSGRSAGAYRSLQMAMRGRFSPCDGPLPFRLPPACWRASVSAASASSGPSPACCAALEVLGAAWMILSRALMAPRPSAPPAPQMLERARPCCAFSWRRRQCG